MFARFTKSKWYAAINQGEVFGPRTGHSAIEVGNKIFVYGGIEDQAVRLNYLTAYRLNTIRNV
jgi:hypothetical protein